MTPVTVLAIAFVVVGFGSLACAAVLRLADRRRSRRLQRWADDWGLVRAEHCHVRVLRRDAS